MPGGFGFSPLEIRPSASVSPQTMSASHPRGGWGLKKALAACAALSSLAAVVGVGSAFFFTRSNNNTYIDSDPGYTDADLNTPATSPADNTGADHKAPTPSLLADLVKNAKNQGPSPSYSSWFNKNVPSPSSSLPLENLATNTPSPSLQEHIELPRFTGTCDSEYDLEHIECGGLPAKVCPDLDNYKPLPPEKIDDINDGEFTHMMARLGLDQTRHEKGFTAVKVNDMQFSVNIVDGQYNLYITKLGDGESHAERMKNARTMAVKNAARLFHNGELDLKFNFKTGKVTIGDKGTECGLVVFSGNVTSISSSQDPKNLILWKNRLVILKLQRSNLISFSRW